MTIKQKFDEGYILGCIKYNERCSLHLMPIAYWILNYKKYDPNYNPEDWDFVFRDNILIVNDQDISRFVKEVEVDKIESNELSKSDIDKLVFYVDFDAKLFVSSFSEIEVEDYLPHNEWQGKYDNPIMYLSQQCRLML